MTWNDDYFKSFRKEGEPRIEVPFNKVSRADVKWDKRVVEGIEEIDNEDMKLLNNIERKLFGGEYDNNKPEGELESIIETDMEDSEGD